MVSQGLILLLRTGLYHRATQSLDHRLVQKLNERELNWRVLIDNYKDFEKSSCLYSRIGLGCLLFFKSRLFGHWQFYLIGHQRFFQSIDRILNTVF